eukprot:CAMPEP_0117436456 /NCGR_PEP_ID=MMETSP0759-20121206/1016_1 /TAXON_ID=63605 /ORGANISM="Percolomonas cosmopolitus, Strain WS" /LENGTH=2571 /DNA_ID=CAMNT_0005228055 /DNA_START=624 /DNA_END=8339 /DNA_ORIENTATION=+
MNSQTLLSQFQSHVFTSSNLRLYVFYHIKEIREFIRVKVQELSKMIPTQIQWMDVAKLWIALQMVSRVVCTRRFDQSKKHFHADWNQFENTIAELIRLTTIPGPVAEHGGFSEGFFSGIGEVLVALPSGLSEWNSLVSTIESLHKEQPERMHPLVVALLRYLPSVAKYGADSELTAFVSSITSHIVPLAISAFKTKDTTLREQGVEMLHSLKIVCDRLRNHPSVRSALVQTVIQYFGVDLLEPGVLTPDARRDLLDGLSRFAQHAPENPTLMKQFFSLMQQPVLAATENEVMRIRAARTVGDWIRAQEDSIIPEDYVTLYKDAFAQFAKIPASVKREILYTLGNVAAENDSFVSDNMKLLFDIVSQSEKKVIERPVAVAALRVLLRAALTTKKIAGQLPSNQVFKKVIGGTTPFLLDYQSWSRYQTDNTKFGVDDFETLADCIGLVLLHHINHLKLKANKPLFETVAKLLSHESSWKARNRMTELFNEVVEKNASLHSTLFEGFTDYLASLESNPDLLLSTKKRHRLTEAFLTVAPHLTTDSVTTNGISVAQVFMYAHHPFFILIPNTYGIHGRVEKFWRAWKLYVTKFINQVDMIQVIQHHLETILEYLTAPNTGLNSSSTFLSKATSFAFASLITPRTAERVIQFLGESLEKDITYLKDFSEEDYEIFHTPEGKVHRDLNDEIEMNPFFYDIPDHKKSKYSLPREEWDQIMKDEQNIKKKNPSSDLHQIKLDLLTKIYLKREGVLKKSIQQGIDRTMTVLDAVESIAKNPHNSTLLQQYVSLVSLYVSDFMMIPVESLSVKAFHTFAACAVAVLPTKTTIARMASSAAFRFHVGEKDTSRNADVDDDSVFAEYVVSRIRMGGTLSAEQFSVILPFLSVLFSKKSFQRRLTLSKVCLSQSMSILGTHAGLQGIRSKIVRPRIIDTIIDILIYHPTLNRQAKLTLLSGAPNMLPADIYPMMNALTSPNDLVRTTMMEALGRYPPLVANSSAFEEGMDSYTPSNPLLLSRLYLARHDELPEICQHANQCWTNYWRNKKSEPEKDQYVNIQEDLLQMLSDAEDFVRNTAAHALGSCITDCADSVNTDIVIKELVRIYDGSLKTEEPNGRMGVAEAVGAFGKAVSLKQLESIYDFIFNKGLKDPETTVCNIFSQSGENLVRTTSETNKKQLSNVFEKHLKKAEKQKPRNQKEQQQLDYTTGNLAVYLGTVARFADYSPAQVKDVVDRLVQTLNIHSGTVQSAVSNALTYLVTKMSSDDIDNALAPLFAKLSEGEYGDRRGAAFGIAGVMSGLGIAGLREFNVMGRLSAVSQKNTSEAREGVMQTFELLSKRMGTLFDPYVPEIISQLLNAISDTNATTCQAADDCATEVMKNITPHSARMILPDVLSNMKIVVGQKVAWRQREATVMLLGAMAYSAPRMLSTYLPKIVDILKDALVEVHAGVSSAARKSLERVGGQAANPEIRDQIPDLIKALSEPTEKSNDVLDALLFTRFTHSIDPCSLALLMPVLQRALRHRDQNLKKKAGQIIGSVSSLVSDPVVLMPYLSTILPLLHELLIDHQPRVRRSAAKSIGSLAKTLGEDRLQDIVDWIHATLQNPNSGLVERQGCSQAVAEMIAAQGVSRLKSAIPPLIEKSLSQYANVRMGYIQVFLYLPELTQQEFRVVLPECMPRVLQGISDDDDNVSRVSFNASQLMIRLFADSAISMVLPALEQGMQEDEWRTRHASVVLLGDFLQHISDTHKPSTIAMRGDQSIHMDTIYARIEKEHVHRLLSLLYILHSDTNSTVRSESHRVWRTCVSHSPKVLRVIMPTLIDVIITHLSHEDEEKRQTGARCIGELVGRMGDTVVSDLIPLLGDRLHSDSPQTRQGVCIGLTELMNASSNKVLKPYVPRLLPAIQRAIADSDADVQESASHAFNVLISVAGSDAVIQVVNAMLKDLHSNNEEKQQTALVGLQKLVQASGEVILNTLVPAIVRGGETISESNAETLAAIASVSGSHIVPHLDILDKLISQIGDGTTPTNIVEHVDDNPIASAIRAILYTTQNNVNAMTIVMDKFHNLLQSNLPQNRIGGSLAIQILCTGDDPNGLPNPKSTFMHNRSEYLPSLIDYVIKLFTDPAAQAVEASWHAFNRLVDLIPKTDLSDYIAVVNSALTDISQDERGNRIIEEVPAFNLPRGLDPMVKLFLEGVMSGRTADIREQAADGISTFIRLTNQRKFEPYVLKLGPLIRIASNKFPWQVKAAVLRSLILLLERGGKRAKPFVPSMQTTFIKSLQSSNSTVRNLSAEALGILVSHGARIKSLVTELTAALKTIDIGSLSFDAHKNGVYMALLKALESIMAAKGREIKDKQIQEMVEFFVTIMENCKDSAIRKQTANTYGACIGQSDLTQNSIHYLSDVAEVLAIGGMAKHCPEKIEVDKAVSLLRNILTAANINADNTTIALECVPLVLLGTDCGEWDELLGLLSEQLENSKSNLMRQTASASIKILAKKSTDATLLYPAVPSILNASKDKFVPVKINLEWAMMYIFALQGGNMRSLENFFASNRSLDGDQVNALREYAKRIVKKIGNDVESDSDNEEGHE